MSRRTDRVNVTIQRELGALIEEDVSDPRLAPVTSITRVECTPDLSIARVYISVLGSAEESAGSLAALESASGYLRRALEGRIRMRHIPRIEFRPDDSIARAAEMLEYMNLVAEEDRRRGVPPPDADDADVDDTGEEGAGAEALDREDA